MIYLPHPTFDFEGANGGSVSGFVPKNGKVSEPVWQTANRNLFFLPIWEIDVNNVISKFDKARSSYWEGRYYKSPDTTYCFLREDGHEFAIRLINADQKWDIITYSRCKPMSSPVIERPSDEFKIWLERVAPIF